MNFYAVAKGRNSGIYLTWDDCKAQVHKFSGPVYKKFHSKLEAENFIKQHSGVTNSISNNSEICSYRPNSLSLKRPLSIATTSNNQQVDNTKRTKYNESNESSGSQNKNKFILDENGYTEVYTDGACTFNGRNNARAGIGIWFSDDNSLNISQPVVGRATNNMAEIQAVTIAAKQAQKAGIQKLKINTDSQFLISCITQWMPKWKKRGWQTNNGKDVINKAELIEMEKALTPLTVKWNHVKGHVGIHGNEMADKLARIGSESYKKIQNKNTK